MEERKQMPRFERRVPWWARLSVMIAAGALFLVIAAVLVGLSLGGKWSKRAVSVQVNSLDPARGVQVEVVPAEGGSPAGGDALAGGAGAGGIPLHSGGAGVPVRFREHHRSAGCFHAGGAGARPGA